MGLHNVLLVDKSPDHSLHTTMDTPQGMEVDSQLEYQQVVEVPYRCSEVVSRMAVARYLPATEGDRNPPD